MMTEAKAREKQCPYCQVVSVLVMLHLEDYPGARRASLCGGGSCMMWRWNPDNPVAEGYCGLAGKPCV